MFFNDHAPPHFHARYGEHRGRVSIETGKPLDGDLPARALRLIEEWCFAPPGRAAGQLGARRTTRAPHANRPASMMSPNIIAALPLRPHVIRVVFADGQVRDADIAPMLDGPIFQPLRDRTIFEQVFVDEETRTVAWPNGADLDPDVLHQAAPPATPHAARVSVPQHA